MSLRLVVLLAAWAMMSCGAPARAGSPMSAGSPELLGKNLVDVGGGKRLNLVCIGRGSPTVVFDQAWAGTILDWQYVQEDVSKLTRTCFYDRAGEGYSDSTDRPRTPLNITDELRALIRAGQLQRPVVLVGHSMGGLYATLYADRFFEDVAGLVLVDPGFSGQNDVALSVEDKRVLDRMQAQVYERMAACESIAQRGQLTLDEPHGCFAKGLPYYTPAEIDHVLPTFQRPSRWAALASQQERMDEERAFARDWGDKPVVVLTRSQFPPIAGMTEAARAAFEVRVKEGHAALARRSTRGKWSIVPDSRHYIQADQPAPVAAAIREVIMEVRNRRRRQLPLPTPR